jgi:hypothetical protein
MEENNATKMSLSEIETPQLKELLRAEQILNNALVMYASVLAAVGGYGNANLATKLAEPHSHTINELIKELSSRKTLDEQGLS